MIREAVVAGRFYPDSPVELREMIASMIDEMAMKEDIIGLVSPHAGYIYSGSVAGVTISRVRLKDTFIILGPNHTGMGKAFSIMTQGTWRTPLGDVEIDSELAGGIAGLSGYLEKDIDAHRYEHSIEVQLPFLQYFKKDFKLVPIVLAQADDSVYKEIGEAIAGAIKKIKREVIIIASSDMTHYESQALAKEKDKRAIEAMLALDEDELIEKVERLKISMCGYAPAISLITAAKALGAKRAELVRYQTSGDISGDYNSVVGYAGLIFKKNKMSPIVKLAKEAVETFIKDGNIISPPVKLTPEMKKKAGVFVSLHKFGQLRGCIGTFEAAREDVAQEIIANAISSATRDPRFPPVTVSELGDLEYSVDVLTLPVPVKDKNRLNPKKHGVIVECDFRRGLLLPDLEGVDTVEKQIEICCQKAGIEPDEPANLYCFMVKRYK
ncbi:MAG: MEMO1 family protein [Dehalococcoidia bacterium]|nr:MAG: MEMO1 family protein [Dehalococcoidia bacterium]